MALRWEFVGRVGLPRAHAPGGFSCIVLAANLLAFSAQAWAGSARVSGAEMNGFGGAVVPLTFGADDGQDNERSPGRT